MRQRRVARAGGALAGLPALKARGAEVNRQWVAANVPALPVTHDDPAAVRASFWARLQEWNGYAQVQEEPLIVLADCGWPVEARFLAACVDDSPEEREWQGPYPLHDLATFLLARKLNPTGRYARRPDELPAHNPLADARQTARIYWDLTLGVLPETQEG